MNVTPIEWTTFSANPLKYRDTAGNIVWGCVHASPGCQHCYSEALAKRYGRGGPFNLQTMAGLTPFLDAAECHKMRTAKQIGGKLVAGSRCFIGDMTDIFGEWVPDDLLNRLFSGVLEIRTDVMWQILTKRAERMHRYLSWRWGEGRIPSRNIHVGVSVENQRFADERIPLLLQTPAAVRFISAEPLLGSVNISHRIKAQGGGAGHCFDINNQWWHEPGTCTGPICLGQCCGRGLDWVIVGGESGPYSRPTDLAWARSIVQQCQAAGVPVFVKQLGAKPCSALNGDYRNTMPLKLHDKKGGDINEFPSDLRVRQFPEVRGS